MCHVDATPVCHVALRPHPPGVLALAIYEATRKQRMKLRKSGIYVP